MSVNINADGHLSPQQVIELGLPDLKIPTRAERVYASSLTVQFKGHMAVWTDFKDEVTKFYRDGDLQQAFIDCKNVRGDDDLSAIQVESPHFAGLEHVQIGDERDLHGRFLANVMKRVLSTLKIIMEPQHRSQARVAELKRMPLTNDINVGSAKTVPKDSRKQYEPDIVFKIPGSGDQIVRVVGELKFPRICCPSAQYADPNSYKAGALRHIFGQVARDMRVNGTRFGFVSTYEETVFLKISRDKEGHDVLYYSDVVHHSQSLIDDDPDGPLTEVSVRFAMLWLIYRASHNDASWSFNPSSIPKAQWTRQGRKWTGPGQLVASYKTPFKAAVKSLTGGLSRLHLTPRPSKDTILDTTEISSLDTPMTPTPAGPTPDDLNDPDYEPSEEETPSGKAGLRAQLDRLKGTLDDDNNDSPHMQTVRPFYWVGDQLRQAGPANDTEAPA